MKQYAQKSFVYAAQWTNDKNADAMFKRYIGAPRQRCCGCGELLSKHATCKGSVVCPTEWYVVGSNGTHCYTISDDEFSAQFCPVGEMSDGYHTFNELYHHRAVLFASLCKCYPQRVWKSLKHHDGSMYDNMFIVGIITDVGDATYHYDVDPYWDMFDCVVLDKAPKWDGHTPEDAIRRIATLKKGN